MLVNEWNFVSLKSSFKQVPDSRIILDLKIVFLKLYNLTVNKFKCRSCTASYYGKAYGYMNVPVSEHQGVSPRTGK